jgi:hypothetical protein
MTKTLKVLVPITKFSELLTYIFDIFSIFVYYEVRSGIVDP